MKKKKSKTPKYMEYEDGTRIELDEDDAPELTDEWFKKAVKFDGLPKSLQRKLSAIQHRGRPRKRPSARKISIHLRIDPDIAKRLRATGKGWQTRLNAMLRTMMAEHRL
ncbi:MAG: BrnA antitoxin family protein [Pseudomonadota bacterium]|nr:BrnA antitoxin family protein [Pseudomonadota bacterium]MDE3037633.1 BrnA antitoxin family protein [Pseudomonadota bacterium]